MKNSELQPQSNNDQEVDFEPLINWFLSITRSISKFFNLLTSAFSNQLKTILSLTIVGLLIGLGVFFFSQKKYSSSIQLATNHTTNLISNNMIKTLTRLATDKSYNALKTTLNISIEQAENISAILYLDHYFLPVSSNEGDTIVEGKPFFIYIETYSPEQITELQSALINYLEQQPLTSEYRERERFEISSKIKKHELELKRLDSLKTIVAQSIEPRSSGSGSGFIYGEAINPIDVYQESERIFDDYLSLKSRLKVLRSVKIISNFTPSEKPIFPRIRHILFYIGIFFLLGFILALRSEIKDRKRKSV